MKFNYQTFKSPVGKLYLIEKDHALCGVIFEKNWKVHKKNYPELLNKDSFLIKKAKKQLAEYFSGKRTIFKLPYKLQGTDFQKSTWKALLKVPYGKSSTYKEQAIRIKSPKAVRAVGRANGLNPLCIILPCHRIIGSNGSLTGYAGGLKTKKFLLALENI